ncbi:uncharacterized protein METZ01_LOCUS199283, partial [marine metagenome]
KAGKHNTYLPNITDAYRAPLKSYYKTYKTISGKCL